MTRLFFPVELPNSPKRSIFNQKIYTLDEIVWLFNHVQRGRSHYSIDLQSSRVLTKYFGTTNVDDAWRIAGGSSNLIFECEPNNNDELNARVFVLKENNIWYRENPSNYEIFNKEYQLTLHKVHYKYNNVLVDIEMSDLYSIFHQSKQFETNLVNLNRYHFNESFNFHKKIINLVTQCLKSEGAVPYYELLEITEKTQQFLDKEISFQEYVLFAKSKQGSPLYSLQVLGVSMVMLAIAVCSIVLSPVSILAGTVVAGLGVGLYKAGQESGLRNAMIEVSSITFQNDLASSL